MYQINFNNLIDLLQHFSTNHMQVKDFGSGTSPQLDRFLANKPTYPIIWANLDNVLYDSGMNQKSFKFNILAMDILDNTESNQNDIWNDSVMILEDLIKFLQWNSKEYYRVNFNQLQITPFTEGKTEYLAGANLQIQIEVDFDGLNNCGIAGYEFHLFQNEIVYTSDETEDN